MILHSLPLVSAVLIGLTTGHETTSERILTRDELLSGFVRKIDETLDLFEAVYMNKSNTKSEVVQLLCSCSSTVFNYDFDKRGSQCEHLVRITIGRSSFAKNYVYIADQMKLTLNGMGLNSIGIVAYICSRSEIEFMNLEIEASKTLAKELLQLKKMPAAIWPKVRLLGEFKAYQTLLPEEQRIVAKTFLTSPTEKLENLKTELESLVKNKGPPITVD